MSSSTQTIHRPFPTILKAAETLKHPFSCLVTGPSQSGKSHWLMQLIKHSADVISPAPDHIVYSYQKYQKLIRDGNSRVEFVQGDAYDLRPEQKTILILDDQMLNQSIPLAHLFTVGVHHDNVSVIYVTHTLFHDNPQFRLASLNTNYFIIFKSVRGAGQVNFLTRQLFLHDKQKARNLIKAYATAMQKPYTYLLYYLFYTKVYTL